ncbi:MAG: M50 family metallopeptidase [Saprospiraceae bacterium]|nr:M50 family metallopeptidase [Saprospiraceae bacterium]
MKDSLVMKIIAIALIYFLLRFMGGSFGQIVLYPVTLLVTFLHEFGHALAAGLTGGSIKGMQINTDGSGVTTTLGGNQAITLLGGYIGSALFGNLLFYIGAKLPKYHRVTLVFLGGLMVFASIFWYESLQSTVVLILYGVALYFIARHAEWVSWALMFFGIASTLYIIQDFNFGPSSDLAHFETVVGIFPAAIWKYIWLAAVIAMFVYNIRLIVGRGALKTVKW